MNWKIYYTDGTTYSDEDGDWENAPSHGVVCVVVKDPDYGRFVLNGLNYYYRPNNAGPLDVAHCNDIVPQLVEQAPWLKFGTGVSKAHWKEILIKATKDPDFGPPKNPQRRSTDK